MPRDSVGYVVGLYTAVAGSLASRCVRVLAHGGQVADRRLKWYDGGDMELLKELSRGKIHTAECDRLRIQLALLQYPEDSFGAAWRVLALAVLETKMAMWRAVCR